MAFRVNKIRKSKSDYVLHKVRNYKGLTALAFVGGILFALNIASVGAQPSSTPTAGNVNANFTSVTAGNIVTDSIVTRRLGYGPIDPQGDMQSGSDIIELPKVRLSGISQVVNDKGIFFAAKDYYDAVYGAANGTEPSNAYALGKTSAVFENLTGDKVYFKDSIVTREGATIGSFRRIYKQVKMNSTNVYNVNETKQESVTCSAGTQIVSCAGRTTNGNGMYNGSRTIYDTNTCESYVTLLRSSGTEFTSFGGSPTNIVEAICFDPQGQATGSVQQ